MYEIFFYFITYKVSNTDRVKDLSMSLGYIWCLGLVCISLLITKSSNRIYLLEKI